jgi:hypothetical protein
VTLHLALGARVTCARHGKRLRSLVCDLAVHEDGSTCHARHDGRGDASRSRRAASSEAAACRISDPKAGGVLP